MPSSSMPWVKIGTDILDDPKLAQLPIEAKWRFIQLIALAGIYDAEGYLIDGDDPMELKDIAWRLRIDIKQLNNDIGELERAKLIVFDDEIMAYLIINFSKRQGRTQQEKRKQWRERQRLHREKERESQGGTRSGHEDVTGDVVVTVTDVTLPEERRVEESRGEGELNGVTADAEPPEPVEKTPKKKKKERDPLLDNPAIIAYREEARLHVPISWREEVCKTVDDSERWKELVHDWIGHGWNKQNISGMLEAYINGGIGKRKEEPAGFDALRSYRQKAGLDNG